MDRRALSQEYYTLAADKNGYMPPMHKDESNAGLVAAGVMDLILNDIITIENKKVTVLKEMPEELAHIASLYTYLNEKPRNTNKLMQDFYTGSRIKQLIADTGESLAADGAAAKKPGGFLGPKTLYIPETIYKDKMIEIIKSAIKMRDDITPHDAALIFILNASKNLNQYFSKQEREELNAKLKEMKKNPQNKQLAEMINYVNELITLILGGLILFQLLND